MLELPNRIFAVVHDGGDERRRSAAFRHGVHHVLRASRAAGSDDGNAHGVADLAGERQLIAVLGPVGVDGVDAQLARAERLAALRPLDGVDSHSLAPP